MREEMAVVVVAAMYTIGSAILTLLVEDAARGGAEAPKGS